MLEKALFKRLRDEKMARPEELQRRAQRKLTEKYGSKLASDFVKGNFDELLDELWKTEFQFYLEEEKRVNVEILRDFLCANLEATKQVDATTLQALLDKHFNQMYDFFISLTQSRRNRAGESFQEHLRFLFSLLKYPFEPQRKLDARVDFVFPSRAMFERNRQNCIVISAKRTLRERWMETVEELAGTQAGRMYLATIDERLTKNMAKRILGYNVTIVTLERIKIEKFSDLESVIPYKVLVCRDIPAFSSFWGGES